MKDIANPDLAFVSITPTVPVIGVALVHSQPKYGNLQRHEQLRYAVESYFEMSGSARINLDTLIQENTANIQSVSQFEALLRRVDVVLTSRLHGLVISLKNGTPTVAIDPIAGGAKVTAQAKALEWPLLLSGDGIDGNKLAEAISKALQPEIRERIRRTQNAATDKISAIHRDFLKQLILLRR
jgi:polysaccharide pyruvyl transferase WcaK-like protein